MIRKFFAVEGAKLKEMNFTDKRQYIWEYYKLHILFVVIILFLTGNIINNVFINPSKRIYLYIAWQAGFVHSEPLDALGERLSIIPEDQERYEVLVRSYEFTDDPQVDQALAARFHAMLAVGNLHATITTREGIAEFAGFGVIRPVTELLAAIRDICPILHNDMADRALHITFTPPDEESPITDAMAISLNHAPLLTQLGLSTDDLYFALMINCYRFYEAAKALRVVFYEGGPDDA